LTFLQNLSVVPFDHHQVENKSTWSEKDAMDEEASTCTKVNKLTCSFGVFLRGTR